mmetsp:Transcript_2406/g.3321  ORF Transcript_2406/g.3321 Transcript_2406/m.3321 type:complete len:106 (+) Transcript_2406:1767-2084(+)
MILDLLLNLLQLGFRLFNLSPSCVHLTLSLPLLLLNLHFGLASLLLVLSFDLFELLGALLENRSNTISRVISYMVDHFARVLPEQLLNVLLRLQVIPRVVLNLLH